MRELDLILQRFLTRHFDQLDDVEKSAFEALLDVPDPELYQWLSGHSLPPQQHLRAMITRIRDVINT